ncbi:hypothetical protein Rhopal_003308-T1 [Rhodotorula paludigena]|uniref:Pheromone-regulated membrane protein 10 n=1 Tax=Rhodotorula paludigena TaxID=86838 RepID=A0AAV5GLA4_9BASI|nr:hypothetical protein Rhopal_003308-T1 [Rhodotorula paludigena]
MADPSRSSSNPFDQPYTPEGGVPSAQQQQPPPAPPTVVVQPHDESPASGRVRADDDAAHDSSDSRERGSDETGSSATMLNTSQGTARSSERRVQWPDLRVRTGEGDEKHVAIDMADPDTGRSLASPGASAELQRALRAHAAAGTDTEDEDESHPRYIGPEGSASRAASSDGDPMERLEQMKDNMEVYIDPGETDGLPSVSKRPPEEKNTRAAWGLVRNLTQGGGLRNRRGTLAKGGFSSGMGANAEGNKDNESEQSQRGLSGLIDRVKEGNVQDVPPEQNFSANGVGSGGILSALIALQQQQQQGDSAATSGVNTPASFGPSSRASSIGGGDGEGDSDDEDDEAERLKFLAKLHEKRAQKTRLHQLAEGVGRGGQGVAVGVGRAGGAVIGTAGRGAGAIVGTAGRGAGAVLGGVGSALGVNSKSHSKSASAEGTPGTASDKGDAKAKDKRGFFARGTTFDPDRPDAAKSDAGVFGGLMLGAGNLAGVATPRGTQLAPDPTRPGTHINRYESTPDNRSRAGSAGSSTQGSPEIGRSTPGSPTETAGHKRNPFGLALDSIKDLPTPHIKGFGHSPGGSPRKELGDYFRAETEEEADRKAWEREKRRRRKAKEKRKAQEVFITQHVAAILERQQFIMKMARAFMMFGAPSHRLEAQMQATARVLEINCQVIYIPGFLKQANGLDLGKLLAAYMIYFNVIHDKISVTDASTELDALMTAPPKYALWQQLIIGAAASAFIQPSAFYGSFIDCLMAMPLGALLVLVQVLVSRNDLYSSLFEIVIACIIAFIAAALASTQYFCFAAVVSGSVVLILPGYIVLCGSLELANRSIISGSVRLVYAILYSLFLGFGLSIGAEIYQRITELQIYGSRDYTCSALRGDGVPWYMAKPSQYWYFLTIPMFLLTLAVRNGQPLFRKETPIMILIGCAGFVSNFFSGKAFTGRSDIVSAIGSFAVGFLGNLYGKFTRGSPFVVMVPGVLVQLPSGLSNGGLLRFADTDENSTSSSNLYSSGFNTAQSLVEVAIGLTVGLFVSAAIVNLLGGGRRRGSNLSSF